MQEDLLKSIDANNRGAARQHGQLSVDDNDAEGSEESVKLGQLHGNLSLNASLTPASYIPPRNNMKMPWAIAARQKGLCSRFLRLFDLVQLMVHASFRDLFLNHMSLLTEIVLPGTIRESHGEGNDFNFEVFDNITTSMESSWKSFFVEKFQFKGGGEEEAHNVIASIDNAAAYAKVIIEELYKSVLNKGEVAEAKFSTVSLFFPPCSSSIELRSKAPTYHLPFDAPPHARLLSQSLTVPFRSALPCISPPPPRCTVHMRAAAFTDRKRERNKACNEGLFES